MEFIVGTALAGVPIVLEAYDRYWKLSGGLSTFRHYSGELAKLDTIMMTQKTLFRANVIKLLTAITNDQEKARNLLSDSNRENLHKLKLPTVHSNIRVESLREIFGSWEAMLELVRHSATAVCVEVERFRTNNVADIRSFGPTEIMKQMPKRFRLCWKKNEVQVSIRELRDFTADFNELTARIVNELEQIRSSPPTQEITMRRGVSHLGILEEYRQIQSASYKLYNVFALRWSCARHQRHAASISPVGECKSTKFKNTEDGIKFVVAIDCEADSLTCRETPIWLEVEATGGSHPLTLKRKAEHIETAPANTWTGVVENIMKHSQPIVIKHVGKVHKRLDKKSLSVQSANDGPVGVVGAPSTLPAIEATADGDQDEEILPTSISATASSSDSIEDLEMIENLCCHFRSLQPMCSNACVGYVQDLGLHRFYLPSPERQPSEQRKTLADIITWISENELSRSPPRTAVAHIASSLAVAVLQYHSTPWLRNSWESSQIHFFGIGELSQDANVMSSMTPYFKAEFWKLDKGKSRLMTTAATGRPFTAGSTTSTSSMRTGGAPVLTSMPVARNELLFSFGIVLLELGYSKLWPQLRGLALEDLPSRRHTDYHAAEKLAQIPLLRNRMGPKFPTIVRKCLGCDFGLGETDLANERLQGMFLADVVWELQSIERGFRELELHSGRG